MVSVTATGGVVARVPFNPPPKREIKPVHAVASISSSYYTVLERYVAEIQRQYEFSLTVFADGVLHCRYSCCVCQSA